ncbi:MAG TPA: N-acetylneuraminate synthase family protein [Vicinamibacterales bacterium]
MWPRIGRRSIGAHAPVLAVAEIGLNHGGDLQQAIALVDAAASAGARAIKLQTLYADRLVAAWCPPPAHVNVSSLREFFSTFELDADAHRAIVTRAREHELAVLSTPFCEDVLPMLEELDIDAYKIASGDLTHDGLIAAAARTGKPVILSTGMSSLTEVLRAVNVARRAGAEGIAVLHCVSAYPTPPGAENLRAIHTMACALDVPVGLSDHSAGGLLSAVAAIALGACIYERHLMLHEDVIDRAVSSTPAEFRAIVDAMERTRLSMGDGRKRCLPAERVNLVSSRRGLYARRALSAGQRITASDVIALRPANALGPADLPRLVDSVLSRDLPAGAPFRAADLAIERAS